MDTDGFMRPCEYCNGTGTQVDSDGYLKNCRECGGTGIYTPILVELAPANDDPRTPAEVAAYEAKQDGEPTSNAYPVHDYMDTEDIETALDNASKQVIELQAENASLRQQLDAARAENVTLTARNQQLQQIIKRALPHLEAIALGMTGDFKPESIANRAIDILIEAQS